MANESIYDIESVEAKAKRAAKQLPDPVGYRILLALPEVKKKTDGGIIRPDEYVGKEAQASIIGFVLKKGPDCYLDKTRFPSGAWCEEGDWVIFRAYSGTRIRIHGQTFCMINDDTVEAVVESPQGIERAV